MKVLLLIIISLLLVSESEARSKRVSKELNSLGTSGKINKMARKAGPRNKIAAVQNRKVKRNHRFELGFQGGLISGGDPYYNTSAIGGQFDYHIIPQLSFGARYSNYKNTLNSEGKRVFSDANNGGVLDINAIPALDYPIDSVMGTITVYPFYGKLKLFSSIVQFDFYGVFGYGDMNLRSGKTGTYSVGGGIAAWLSQNVTTRLEYRYQKYKDRPVPSMERDIGTGTFFASLGLLI